MTRQEMDEERERIDAQAEADNLRAQESARATEAHLVAHRLCDRYDLPRPLDAEDAADEHARWLAIWELVEEERVKRQRALDAMLRVYRHRVGVCEADLALLVEEVRGSHKEAHAQKLLGQTVESLKAASRLRNMPDRIVVTDEARVIRLAKQCGDEAALKITIRATEWIRIAKEEMKDNPKMTLDDYALAVEPGVAKVSVKRRVV